METAMAKMLKRLLIDETGATAIEYGLIAALIGVGLLAVANNWAVGSTWSCERSRVQSWLLRLLMGD